MSIEEKLTNSVVIAIQRRVAEQETLLKGMRSVLMMVLVEMTLRMQTGVEKELLTNHSRLRGIYESD